MGDCVSMFTNVSWKGVCDLGQITKSYGARLRDPILPTKCCVSELEKDLLLEKLRQSAPPGRCVMQVKNRLASASQPHCSLSINLKAVKKMDGTISTKRKALSDLQFSAIILRINLSQ